MLEVIQAQNLLYLRHGLDKTLLLLCRGTGEGTTGHLPEGGTCARAGTPAGAAGGSRRHLSATWLAETPRSRPLTCAALAAAHER